MTGAVSEVLEKMGMVPTDIDILVTCTSIFCPTPSSASMLVNRCACTLPVVRASRTPSALDTHAHTRTYSLHTRSFKMRPDVQSYHLGGMGCGTGVVGVNLIRDLLIARPNAVAVFVPSEITSYCGCFCSVSHSTQELRCCCLRHDATHRSRTLTPCISLLFF
jgi:3-ketoacyl-CoA synthase